MTYYAESRDCTDCVPPMLIQGGGWGWQSHRFYLHDEGTKPETSPYDGNQPPPPGRRPRTEAEKAQARRAAAARSRSRPA